MQYNRLMDTAEKPMQVSKAAQIRALKLEGVSNQEIQDRLGVSRQYIFQAMHSARHPKAPTPRSTIDIIETIFAQLRSDIRRLELKLDKAIDQSDQAVSDRIRKGLGLKPLQRVPKALAKIMTAPPVPPPNRAIP